MRNGEGLADQVLLLAARRLLAPGPEDELLWFRGGPAGLAPPVSAHRSPAARMGERPPEPVGHVVLVPPRDQRPDRRPQPLPLLGQRVLVTAARRGCPRQDLVLDQQVEPLGQHRAGNAEVITEVTEAADAVERVPDDQQGPSLADDLQRPGQGAVLTLVGARQCHGSKISLASSVNEPLEYEAPKFIH